MELFIRKKIANTNYDRQTSNSVCLAGALDTTELNFVCTIATKGWTEVKHLT